MKLQETIISILIITICCLFPLSVFAEEAETEAEEDNYSFSDAPQFNPIPLDEGETSPVNGILIDERTGSELSLLRASDRRLRIELNVRQQLWTEQTEIYNDAIDSLQQQVQTLTQELAGREPSWWDQHGSVFIGTIGFVIGAAATILVAWAVAEAVSPDLVTAE